MTWQTCSCLPLRNSRAPRRSASLLFLPAILITITITIISIVIVIITRIIILIIITLLGMCGMAY